MPHREGSKLLGPAGVGDSLGSPVRGVPGAVQVGRARAGMLGGYPPPFLWFSLFSVFFIGSPESETDDKPPVILRMAAETTVGCVFCLASVTSLVRGSDVHCEECQGMFRRASESRDAIIGGCPPSPLVWFSTLCQIIRRTRTGTPDSTPPPLREFRSLSFGLTSYLA